MKKIISWGMMLAAAFTLTNCAKEIDAPVQEPESVGYPFEIIASTVDTKTVNDGMSTKWAAGDQINLFHAVGETTEYVNNNAFTLADVAEDRFTGDLAVALDPQEEYDWFAFYPYSSYITTPGQQTNGYTYIGSRSDTPQSQTGVDNMNHIAGEKYPLYGKAVAIGAGVKPELTMYHASTLLQINVTNTLNEDLSIENISFTAPEGTSLVGTFYLDITGDGVAYADGQYVSNVANLSVADATIAPDATASFYLAVKPFTAVTESELKIAVNGYEKTLKMSKDVTFTAGKIKTLKFGYDKEETPAPETAEELTIDFSTLEYANGTAVSIVDAAPITVEFNKGSNSNSPTYYTTGSAIRVYGGNTFVVSTLLGKIVKVEFVFASGEDDNDITADSGTYTAPSWNGASQSVKFTISGTKGHRRIQKMKVTYDTNGEAIESEQLSAPQVTCTAETSSSLAFSWNAVEHARGYEVSFNGEAPEVINVTTYAKNDLDPETEYQISVKAIGDGTFYTDSELTLCKGTTSAASTSGGTPVDATLSFANKAQRTSYSTSKQVWEQNGITFTNDKSSSTSNVADYANPVRLYANSKVTVTALGKITKIVFDANSTSYATAMKNSIGTVSGATVTVSSDKVTVTFTDAVDSFVVAKLTAQVRMDSITVTYLQQ